MFIKVFHLWISILR